MIACSKESDAGETPKIVPTRNKTLDEDLEIRESPSDSDSNHVVIVMDALKEFSMEPLLWALKHIIKSGYNVTLLGITPWLNLPLSCKIWLDIWTLNLDDMSTLKERDESKNYRKYRKVRGIVRLCKRHGVVPHMKVDMGYPMQLLVLECTTKLHATWVVFDRHQRKYREFYAKRIPSNVVMMNHDGEVDMLNARRMIDYSGTITPGESPASFQLVPQLIIPKRWMKILKPKENAKEEIKEEGIGEYEI